MNRLSKQKRNQLMLVALIILAVVCGLWFLLIGPQQESLKKLAERKALNEKKRAEIHNTINNSREIESELLVVSRRLQAKEEDMVSGDLYSSMVNSIRAFKLPHKVDIPSFAPAPSLTEATLLPKFPYKQFVVTISGTAHYFDLGRFVADFENRFPTSRIANLELSPASTVGPDEKEKLSFKMDIVALVKPTGL